MNFDGLIETYIRRFNGQPYDKAKIALLSLENEEWSDLFLVCCHYDLRDMIAERINAESVKLAALDILLAPAKTLIDQAFGLRTQQERRP